MQLKRSVVYDRRLPRCASSCSSSMGSLQEASQSSHVESCDLDRPGLLRRAPCIAISSCRTSRNFSSEWGDRRSCRGCLLAVRFRQESSTRTRFKKLPGNRQDELYLLSELLKSCTQVSFSLEVSRELDGARSHARWACGRTWDVQWDADPSWSMDRMGGSYCQPW
jgi:hypothetical protein